VLDLLNSSRAPYCILHGYVGFPDRVDSDVDCILSAELLPRGLPRLLSRHRERLGARVVQWLQHESTAHYFVLATVDRAAPTTFLAFDASSDYRAHGRRFYSGPELLALRRPWREFWVLPPAQEFGYYLVKRIAKAALGEGHQRRLSELFAEDPAGCTREIARFWPPQDTELIAAAARESDWERALGSLAELRHRLLVPRSAAGVWDRISFFFHEAARRLFRWWHPTGLMVVLLGPDGAGKSSVAERLRVRLAPAFRRTSAGHWSPDLLGRAARRGSAGSESPHGQAPHSHARSILKACYWLLDFGLGYWVRVRPALVRSTLVVYDRYLPDAAADPHRYRFAGPTWLVRLIGRLVPPADLTIVLDAPPEILRRRKQEVTPAETARQREAYRSLVMGQKGHVVDASQPLEAVVTQIETIVLEFLANRAARRLRLGPHG
jgi:thymidylate kinase